MIPDRFIEWAGNGVASMPQPTPEMVDAAAQFTGRIDQIIAQVAKLAPIIPFDGIAVAAGISLAFLGVALVLQVSRIVLSVLTLGGGGV